MASQIEKKYKETIEAIFRELTPEDLEQEVLEPLLQPLRIYVNDIARFHTAQIFTAKFRKFLATRDRVVTLTQELAHHGLLEEARRYQQQINQILDQALSLLNRGLEDSASLTEDIDAIIAKIEEAKNINTVRALSEAVIDAGREVRDRQDSIREGLTKLTAELTNCRNQIDDLESQLADTRVKAERDHLTGLRNRRAFDRDLEEAIERAHRFENPLCLLILDLDHFKKINDDYDKRIGDDVLINFARLLESSLRDFDLTYRIAGDKFAVVFSGCPLKRAQSVGERVRKYLADHRYRIDDHEFRLTISGGLAELKPGDDARSLLQRADQQLDSAKNEGRNRVKSQGA